MRGRYGFAGYVDLLNPPPSTHICTHMHTRKPMHAHTRAHADWGTSAHLTVPCLHFGQNGLISRGCEAQPGP